MSQASRRHLRLETIDGVTVVSFVDTKIVTEENIQEVGDQLYSLVEDEGHRQLLLNFGNVQYLSSAARLRPRASFAGHWRNSDSGCARC